MPLGGWCYGLSACRLRARVERVYSLSRSVRGVQQLSQSLREAVGNGRPQPGQGVCGRLSR